MVSWHSSVIQPMQTAISRWRASEVGDEITQTIADWEGRIIVAAVASNLSRIQQVLMRLQIQVAELF